MRTHSHPCAMSEKGCRHRIPCSGDLERNDGFPEVICTSYHLPSGEVDAQLCETCHYDTCVLCERVVGMEGHGDDCSQREDA